MESVSDCPRTAFYYLYSVMAPEHTAVQKNFKLLKYKYIIYHFKACGLEISNIIIYIITLAKYSSFEKK